MTAHHKYIPLWQGDGRPQKVTAIIEPWTLASQRKSVAWVACLLLMICFFSAPMFSSDFLFNYNAQEDHPETGSDIALAPPALPEIIAPHLMRLINFSVGDCDLRRGEWIPYPDEPAYTNASCQFIQDTQNCIGNGRPDLGFLNWRWKPYDCELPSFDAKAFLKIVTGKKWAFIGDSIARNNLQSVLCYLSQVEMPEVTDYSNYNFRSYNFTLTLQWAPFLVRFTEDEVQGFAQGIPKLYVDEVEQSWAPSLHTYDYILVSAGQWFLRPSVYFVENKAVACHGLPTTNITDRGYIYGYGTVLRTVFDYLISSDYKGIVFLKTFAPSHWENAAWDQGGNCTRKAPLQSNAASLDGSNLDMYKVQLEEFAKTIQRSLEFSFKLKIVDVTQVSLLRPDAHPGRYGYFHPKAQNDCLHWCLPGAVDWWSAMLLDMLRHLE